MGAAAALMHTIGPGPSTPCLTASPDRAAACCSGCCGKAKDDVQKEPKSLKKRFCTDVLCLAIFFAFIVVLAVIFYMAYATGDWQSIVYDADYLGNRCGVGDKAALPKAFYPRIPRDSKPACHTNERCPIALSFLPRTLEDHR